MALTFRLALISLIVLLSVPALARDVPASLMALAKKGLHVGAAFVVDGQPVAHLNPDRMFNPASVAKLFTAAAALEVLGADRTLETQVVAVGNGKSRKSLTIVGSGDPLLSGDDLRTLAGCVRKAGVQRVERLVVDLGPFDSSALPPAYEQKSTEAPYRAGIGGLQVDRNRIVVEVFPGKRGKPPRVTVSPKSDYTRVHNTAVTSRKKKGRRKGLSVTTRVVGDGRLEVRVKGTASRKRSEVVARRVPHPARHAGHVFKRALRDTGVKVGKGPAVGGAPVSAEVLCSHQSSPLSQLLLPLLKDSQNQVAESLLRLVGAVGADQPVGFEAGPRVMKTFLQKNVGLKTGSFNFRNGSGLYDANRVSIRAVVNLLRYVRGSADQKPLIEALPVAGRDGTLKRRMVKGPLAGRVRAKTGTLDKAVTLAGFMDLPDGRTLVFAVMVGGKKVNASAVRRATDKALLEVYGWFAK